MKILVGNDQSVSVESGAVLNQGINHRASGGEIGNLFWLLDDELPVKDIVIGIIATVDDKWKINHKSGGVALAVGAGIGFVGGHAVIGQKLRFTLPIDDDASAGTFHVRSNVEPVANKVQIIILRGIRIYRYWCKQYRPIRVLRVFLASMQKGQEHY